MLDINTITKGAVNQNSILSINVTNPESIKNQKNILYFTWTKYSLLYRFNHCMDLCLYKIR